MSIEQEKKKMNKTYILSFSKKGHLLAIDLAKELNGEAIRVKNLKEEVKNVFQRGNIIIFVGAIGIATRGIAPLIKNKTMDPAVIVVDELGQYVIPILSGHIGGANEYAMNISKILNATPIITTATDINNVFAVDTYAKKNNYHIINPNMIKNISTSLLEDKGIGIKSEFYIKGILPKNILEDFQGHTGIYIGNTFNDIPFENTLYLRPKIFHVGIGARKGILYNDLNEFFLNTIEKLNIPIECVMSFSSIDIKKDEEAIKELSKSYDIPFKTYTTIELKEVSDLFIQSEFVKKITGVGNVCESSAYLSSKRGNVVSHKESKNGITLSIYKENWEVEFN